MLALRQRGRSKTYHIDLMNGRVHAVRGSLGTRDRGAALRLQHRVEMAIAQGPQCSMWPELRPVLPPSTFSRLAEYFGVKERHIPTWAELREKFEAHKMQQVKMKELANETLKNYQRSLNTFEMFLATRHIRMLQEIDRAVVEDFCVWRIDQVKGPNCRGGAPSLRFDIRHLHHVFEFARELELIARNPVPATSNGCDRHISRPFSADEDAQWEECARQVCMNGQFSPSDEWVPYWLLRWTGFRNWDAINLLWREISFENRIIEHVCHKNHKRVVLPILEELLPVLVGTYNQRNPLPEEPVLVHPFTGNAFTNAQLWQLIVDLGKRAGVPDSHPYRFRGTFAVEMLLRSNNPYHVANLLGDTMAIVERHYMPYVRELREHGRLLLERGVGLRQFVTRAPHCEALAS